MKKAFVVALVLMGVCGQVFAGQIIERHTFYSLYDPASTSFVYSDAGATSTGDQVAVNTYTHKTIQVTGVLVNENVHIQIEGRSKNQVNDSAIENATNWAVLDTVQFGSASANTSVNKVVDVTEYVDFLRVGIRQDGGSSGTSYIDVEGLFTNLER